MRYLFTCRSLTYAQRASRLLEHAGINNFITKSPAEISDRGCGYSLSVNHKHARKAAEILKINRLYRKAFLIGDDMSYKEVVF